MTFSQLVIRWEKANTPPGFTVIASNNVLPSPGPLSTLAGVIKNYVPPDFTLRVLNTGRLIDETNGKMTGVWSNGLETSVVGVGAGSYAPAAGLQTKWNTNQFKDGHRVAGMSYWVPLNNGAFTTTGIGLGTVVNAINAASTQFITDMAASFVIWSRPLFVLDADGKPTDTIKRAGSIHPVSTSTVPLAPVTLRGRQFA